MTAVDSQQMMYPQWMLILKPSEASEPQMFFLWKASTAAPAAPAATGASSLRALAAKYEEEDRST